MTKAEIKREELIKAIEEIAMSTGITTKECIRQAIELLKEENNAKSMATMEEYNKFE